MASEFSIRHAAHIIRQGGIIAYPTDTIYGLGCNPYDADAVTRLNDIKHRPLDKHFIMLAGHIDQITALAELNKEQLQTITQTTEATSWIVKAKPSVPSWLTSDSNTITVRLSRQNDVRRLCHALGHTIISTSANPSGKTPAKNSLELHRYFHGSVDKILADNKKLTARPSKIIRLCDNQIIRQ